MITAKLELCQEADLWRLNSIVIHCNGPLWLLGSFVTRASHIDSVIHGKELVMLKIRHHGRSEREDEVQWSIVDVIDTGTTVTPAMRDTDA